MIEKMAQRLKDLRISSGLSREQVADRIGCSISNIASYELGNSQPPPEILMKLAVAYRTTTDYILGLSPSIGFDLSELSPLQREHLEDIIRRTIIFFKRKI